MSYQDDTNEKRRRVVLDPVPLRSSFGGAGWRTPELPAGYFITSSRSEYSRSSLEADTPEQTSFTASGSKKATDGPTVSAHLQSILRKVTLKQQTTKRAGVAGTAPSMKRATVEATEPPMKRAGVEGTAPPIKREFSTENPTMKRAAVGGMLPPKKRPNNVQNGDPYVGKHTLPPGAPTREPENDESRFQKQPQVHEERIDSSRRAQRDPLLHRSVVTPPCPIRSGQNETPKALRSYTHVSTIKKHCCKFSKKYNLVEFRSLM